MSIKTPARSAAEKIRELPLGFLTAEAEMIIESFFPDNKLLMVNCEITEPAKPLTLEELQKAQAKIEAATFGMLTEIHGRPADLIRLAAQMLPIGHDTMVSMGIGCNMVPLSAVKLIEVSERDMEAGHVQCHFIGKGPETFKLW